MRNHVDVLPVNPNNVNIASKNKYDIGKQNSDMYLNSLAESILAGEFTMVDDKLRDLSTPTDDVLDCFQETMLKSSKQFVKISKGNSRNKRGNKAWFDKECKHLKDKTVKRLRKFRSSRSVDDLELYQHNKKVYKNVCKRKRLAYEKAFVTKLETNVNNSRVFWKEVKKLYHNHQSVNSIDKDSWYEYFSSLLANDDGQENQQNIGYEGINVNDEEIGYLILNSPITDNEIIDSIRDLNVNKATSGVLVAEHFIYGIDIIVPFIKIFFNRLLDTGEFPTTWAKQVLFHFIRKAVLLTPTIIVGLHCQMYFVICILQY